MSPILSTGVRTPPLKQPSPLGESASVRAVTTILSQARLQSIPRSLPPSTYKPLSASSKNVVPWEPRCSQSSEPSQFGPHPQTHCSQVAITTLPQATAREEAGVGTSLPFKEASGALRKRTAYHSCTWKFA